MHNMYWEIDGIPGESTSAQGAKMIELLSYNHGISMPVTAAGGSNTSRTHGRADHQDFTVAKYLDIASPTLNLMCTAGKDIKTMVIHIWKADAQGTPHEYLTYSFESCIITSISVGGSGSDQPVETVTFNYEKITWDYAQQKMDSPGGKEGKGSAQWDLRLNKGA